MLGRAVAGLVSLFSGSAAGKAAAGPVADPFPNTVPNMVPKTREAAPRPEEAARIDAPAARPAVAPKPASAPGKEAGPKHEAAGSFLCREPILNRNQDIIGYEFLLHSGISQGVRTTGKHVESLMTEILVHNIVGMDLASLLGNRLAFVRIPDWLLWSPLILQVPPRGCVLTLTSSDQQVDAAEVIAQATILRNTGYSLALDGEWSEDLVAELAACASFIFIDVTRHAPPDLRRLIAVTARKFPGVKIIGKNVGSYDDFELCRSAGCDLFHGAFVTSAENWAGNRISPNMSSTFNLLNQLRRDSDSATLVKALKHDPILTYRLLRYANSAAVATQGKTSTIEQALILLGRDRLFRWATLVAFNSVSGKPGSSAVMEHAMVRARMMELLAKDSMAPEHHDRLFTTGLFSLFDRLLQVPLETIVNQLGLADEATSALLRKQGPYAPYLELALACEGGDRERLALLADNCGISATAANAIHLQALQWARESQE